VNSLDEELEDEPIVGQLVKIVSADEHSGLVHARLLDGRTMQWTTLNGTVPDVGDVGLISGDRWTPGDADSWTIVSSTAIVRSVLEDGTVLIDDGLRVVPIRNPASVEVAEGNTVEYNDIEGIVRVLSNTPIRSARLSGENEEDSEDFLVPPSADGPTFAGFGGYPHVIARARELIETQFSRRELLQKIGARPVKGILFTGPPGTGKTYLARILASESGAAFYLVSGPSIISKWIGGSEGRLRRIFEAATASSSGKAIIFFDEIDSIAERRTGDSHESSKRLVAQLLTLMDGFDDKGSGVMIIAATNRAEALDPAVTRPGRFDWEIEFGLPTYDDRVQILEVAQQKHQTTDDLPLADIAAATNGWSAAKLVSIWTEAALIAAGDGRDRIAGEDMAQGYESVAMRPDRSIDLGETF
jgi:transitional endoplasmic reticulum ATPase